MKKTKSQFAVKFAERRDRTFSACLMNHLFKYLALLIELENFIIMTQWNHETLTGCVNNK